MSRARRPLGGERNLAPPAAAVAALDCRPRRRYKWMAVFGTCARAGCAPDVAASPHGRQRLARSPTSWPFPRPLFGRRVSRPLARSPHLRRPIRGARAKHKHSPSSTRGQHAHSAHSAMGPLFPNLAFRPAFLATVARSYVRALQLAALLAHSLPSDSDRSPKAPAPPPLPPFFRGRAPTLCAASRALMARRAVCIRYARSGRPLELAAGGSRCERAPSLRTRATCQLKSQLEASSSCWHLFIPLPFPTPPTPRAPRFSIRPRNATCNRNLL